MASGYDYILIDKPASADELIRAIDVAKEEFTDGFST